MTCICRHRGEAGVHLQPFRNLGAKCCGCQQHASAALLVYGHFTFNNRRPFEDYAYHLLYYVKKTPHFSTRYSYFVVFYMILSTNTDYFQWSS